MHIRKVKIAGATQMVSSMILLTKRKNLCAFLFCALVGERDLEHHLICVPLFLGKNDRHKAGNTRTHQHFKFLLTLCQNK